MLEQQLPLQRMAIAGTCSHSVGIALARTIQARTAAVKTATTTPTTEEEQLQLLPDQLPNQLLNLRKALCELGNGKNIVQQTGNFRKNLPKQRSASVLGGKKTDLQHGKISLEGHPFGGETCP